MKNETNINCYNCYTSVSNYESARNIPFNAQLIQAVLSWYTLFTYNICHTVTVFKSFYTNNTRKSLKSVCNYGNVPLINLEDIVLKM